MLKFVPLEDSVDIDWLEGSKIRITRPEPKIIRAAYAEGRFSYEDMLFISISGWDNIELGDSGITLEFNEANKKDIHKSLINDISFLLKFKTFWDGPLKNSEPGRTSSLKENGTPITAGPVQVN